MWANLASPNRMPFGHVQILRDQLAHLEEKEPSLPDAAVVAPGAQAKNQQLLNDSAPNSTRLVPVSLELYRVLYNVQLALMMVPLVSI